MIKTHFELHLGLYNFDTDSFYRYLALMYDFFFNRGGKGSAVHKVLSRGAIGA